MIRGLYDGNFTNVAIINNVDVDSSDSQQYETQETFLFAQDIILSVAKYDLKYLAIKLA